MKEISKGAFEWVDFAFLKQFRIYQGNVRENSRRTYE